MTRKSVTVIPAYKPANSLPDTVVALIDAGIGQVVVVDDGSGRDFAGVFQRCTDAGATVLRHAVNLGKGSALKTAFNHVLVTGLDAAGVVTADADGQHHVEDILSITTTLDENPDCLVLGVRIFDSSVPLRSRVGNNTARILYRILLGSAPLDTQTGLRGIPMALLADLLRISSAGYEFELDMLVAAKHRNVEVLEAPIRTIYEHGNSASHFRPVRDSIRVTAVLVRFAMLSLATSVVDNLVFLAVLSMSGTVAGAQTASRLIAMTFNYPLARRAVFLSKGPHRRTLVRYALLVAFSGTVSYGCVRLLSGMFAMSVWEAKLIAETILFWFNFIAQRDYVFTLPSQPKASTNWDAYYRSTPPTARLTRRYTQSVLSGLIERFAVATNTITEIGGANSCFSEELIRRFHPRRYRIIDSNRYGLELLASRANGDNRYELHCADIHEFRSTVRSNVVFSIGLIEHFAEPMSRAVILRHFDLVEPGGLVIIGFPTPTWLYRVARRLAESFGAWRFHDERPLQLREARDVMAAEGDIVWEGILWPIVFTQAVLVAKKARTPS